jgi:hypothetical protein
MGADFFSFAEGAAVGVFEVEIGKSLLTFALAVMITAEVAVEMVAAGVVGVWIREAGCGAGCCAALWEARIVACAIIVDKSGAVTGEEEVASLSAASFCAAVDLLVEAVAVFDVSVVVLVVVLLARLEINDASCEISEVKSVSSVVVAAVAVVVEGVDV